MGYSSVILALPPLSPLALLPAELPLLPELALLPAELVPLDVLAALPDLARFGDRSSSLPPSALSRPCTQVRVVQKSSNRRN